MNKAVKIKNGWIAKVWPLLFSAFNDAVVKERSACASLLGEQVPSGGGSLEIPSFQHELEALIQGGEAREQSDPSTNILRR